MQDDAKVLWTPSETRIQNANFTRFIEQVNEAHGLSLTGYWDTQDWSITDLSAFWSSAWDFLEIKGEKGQRSFEAAPRMQDAKFFPDAKLNIAETMLAKNDDGDAIVFWSEDKVKTKISWAQLHDRVSQLQQLLQANGIKSGDRVAAIIPNMPEAISIMLATASLGAILSTASPDFGEQGILDRFGQIEPKVLFVVDGYTYNGKDIDVRDKMAAVAAKIPSIQAVYGVSLLGLDHKVGEQISEALKPISPKAVAFEPLPFDQPLFILFSSGTTGVPKCIVHRAGGYLIQVMKEHQLHCDIKPDDRVFYFTTTGWMMWNWLIGALASKATVLLYDGSPFARNEIVFDFLEAEKATFFGTSAKYIDALAKTGLKPKETHDLSALKTMGSTGSPLVHEGFDYVYESIKSDLHLASVSGGTDICACFVGANPLGPVHRGEVQAPLLGMATFAFDEEGKPLQNEKGELVCAQPFPSMPLTFWGEGGDAKYEAAYFEGFDGVWTHGDYVMVNGETGGFTFYGRSDATLNPQGVRIGTAEIYRQVEQLPEVLESIVIGQEWENDTRVVLFVMLAEGFDLTDDLKQKIKTQIRTGASPRHVPAVIAVVDEIPRTKSGKIVELAVREVVHGRAVKNKEALANPEALDLFANRPELQA